MAFFGKMEAALMSRHAKTLMLISVIISLLCPIVNSQNAVYSLKEEQSSNTYLGNVAEDSDLKSFVVNPNDLVSARYSFLTQNNPHVSLFHINERDSSLYTSKILDRESLCEFKTTCQFSLEVIARCQNGGCYNKIRVTVNLLDINDNFPIFPKQKLEISFSEGSFLGASVPIDSAIDKDQGNFSVQEYTLQQLYPTEDLDHFAVTVHKYGDISTVNIVLNGKLDRENQSRYQLRLFAADGGSPPKTGSVDVNITVTDLNDNPPLFSQRTYNISVNEDIAFNSTILSVTAADPDEGINGQVFYMLSPNQDDHIHNLFDINENTGDIHVIGSLIYEPGENYKIIVWARDQAAQPLVSQAVVFVSIKDVHNNPPQINVNLLSNSDVAEIPENASLNAAVAHIKVYDPDNGLNGIVNCTVNSDNFKLQRFDLHEYKVVVSKSLNRESIDQHSVTIFCKDSGNPSLNASTRFLVHVLDVNDNAPAFSHNVYSLNTPENNDIGISLLKVSATDFDSGKNAEIRYSVRSTSGEIEIDPTSGVITAGIIFDRENKSKMEFEVIASDGGTPTLSSVAKVEIFLNDINDNSPKFSENEYIFSIHENQDSNSIIGVIAANDSDILENAQMEISIQQQGGAILPFRILENGSLIALTALDRETRDRYDFTVVAIDKGTPPMKSSVHVTVFILDVNDNSPVFLFPNNKNKTIEISYQTPPNTIVSTVSTKDDDEGLSSKVTYFLQDNSVSSIFQLNSISGRIILAKHLTISDCKTYDIGITAQDKGTPPRSTDQMFTIIVSTQQLDGSVVSDIQGTHKEYFLIAVAITCVTIVLAVVIVIAIFLIRRADRLKYTKSKPGTISGDKNGEPRKKVSFSTTSDVRMQPIPLIEHEDREKQLYVGGQECIQVSLKGTPDKFSGVETGIVAMSDRKQNHMSTFLDHPASGRNNKRRHHGTASSPTTNPLNRADGDTHSNLSEEFTTSDSGRGGSEEDFNTSTILSYSAEFDDVVKSSSPRIPYSSFRTFSPRHSDINDDVFSNNDCQGLQLPVQTVSLADKFYKFENPNSNIYSKRNSSGGPLSPSVETSMFSCNDGSTTTSGSYIIDSDDEKHFEVVQPSRRCIV